jgi:hypothetical protein
MRLGLRALLLLVALILFIVAALSDGESAFNFLCIGLACFAGAFLADDLPVGGGFGNIGGSGGRRDN